jgi:hypothetical protein
MYVFFENDLFDPGIGYYTPQISLEKCFFRLSRTQWSVHFHNPQWSTGWKQSKMGKHSGPLGRNSRKWALCRNLFVSAQNWECFSAIIYYYQCSCPLGPLGPLGSLGPSILYLLGVVLGGGWCSGVGCVVGWGVGWVVGWGVVGVGCGVWWGVVCVVVLGVCGVWVVWCGGGGVGVLVCGVGVVVWGVCGVGEGVSLLRSNIPRSALCATLDTYNFYVLSAHYIALIRAI